MVWQTPPPPAQPVLYSWSWAARRCPWRPADQEVASNYVTPTDEPREGNNKNKRLKERRPRLGPVVYRLSLRCQRCKRHEHFNTSLSRAYWTNRNFTFQVANSLAEGLVLLSAPVVTLNAPLHAACNAEDYTSRGVLCTQCSFSWKKTKQNKKKNEYMLWITCTDRRAEQSVLRSLQLPRVKYEHREQLPIMLLPSVHLLVWNTQPWSKALKVINIHTTFICGNVAHGVGVLVSGTG